MVPPVVTTDYTASSADDGGVNKNAQLTVTAVFGTEAVEFTLANSDTAAIWVTKLQVRGKGIYLYDPVQLLYEDTTSQATHGILPLSVDMKYQDDPVITDSLAG
jgi:hypothetical protein